jgi:hypothetical protein
MVNPRRRKSRSPIRQLIDESKYASRKLIFNGQDIRFDSEQDLESYLEDKFEEIFPDLNLLSRQYTSSNQRCDLICAKKENKQLVIIELKNQVDRYIVSQLIRYRKALLLEQPFSDLIDYSLAIELIAISPSFHEDNHTDREACKFENSIQFLNFNLRHENGIGKFHLLEKTHDVDFPIAGLSETSAELKNDHYLILPEISWITGRLSSDDTKDFLILHSLFTRQPMVKHWVIGNGRILYSTGKGENSKKLAEITNTDRGLYLYLWLPSYVKTNVKLPLARFGLVCDLEFSPLSLTSTVKWVVCTNETVNRKESPDLSEKNICSFTRQGMRKWSKSSFYLAQAAPSYSNSFSLLMYLLKELKKPFEPEDFAWWEEIQSNTPTNLSWYVDLAVKTWNYRLK